MKEVQDHDIAIDLDTIISAENCLILNSNEYEHGFDNLATYSNNSLLSINNFEDLNNHIQSSENSLYGHIGYDAKNLVADLNSKNNDLLGWDDFLLFEAANTFKLDPFHFESSQLNPFHKLNLKPEALMSKVEYVDRVNQIKEYIRDGEVYELNYCIPFVVEQVNLDPFAIYQTLNQYSKMPFSAFFKAGNKYIISASPERFIKKTGSTLISQPMKGTSRRSENTEEDARLKELLTQSEKERAENLMIVDLIRHDFKKSCKTGSIQVRDLFDVKSYPHVHQMISSIHGEVLDNIHIAEVIKNCFPMGSMTGAPKIRAMELIDELEVLKRGPFSGTLGHITPHGDFDFNVLIRSIFYDADQQILTFQAGSAITLDSDPLDEYNECLLKANAILHSIFGIVI